MLRRLQIVGMCVIGLLLSSCATWRTVNVAPAFAANNEIVMRPELQKLIAEKRQNLKIVLRVPNAPKNVTQESQKELDARYDMIERECAKAGFIVRDRELVEKVLSTGKTANFLELAQTIDTDLLLEILYIGPYDLSHKRYFDAAAGRDTEILNPSLELKNPKLVPFAMQGGRLDCRVITVKDGTVSGMFTVYNEPCGGLCPFEVLNGKEWRNPEPNPALVRGWNVGSDEQNARQLAALLVQTLQDGEISVASVLPGSIAAKQGIRANDMIVKINSQRVYNIPQAMDLLIKTDGSMDLMLRRDSQDVSLTFSKKAAEPIGVKLAFAVKKFVQAPPPPPPAPVEAVPAPPAPPQPAPLPPAAPVKKKPAKRK